MIQKKKLVQFYLEQYEQERKGQSVPSVQLRCKREYRRYFGHFEVQSLEE